MFADVIRCQDTAQIGASGNSGRAASANTGYDLTDWIAGFPAVRYSRLTPLLSGAMNVLIRTAVNTMLETKFLRLRTPVELGSRFDDWQVCWLGGWGKHRLFYLVMVVRVKH